MNKQGKTRFLTVALCLVLAFGVMGGCTKNNDPDSEAGPSNSGNPTGSEATGDGPGYSGEEPIYTDASGSEVDPPSKNTNGSTQKGGTASTTAKSSGSSAKVNKTGMPIVSGGTVQVSIMLPRVTGSPASLDDLSFTKEIKAKTGIDLKYIIINEGDQYTKKVAAITSGNMPDIFALYGGVFSSDEIYKYGKEGALADISGLLKEWAPNINKALDAVSGARASATLSTGKIYGLPGINAESFGQTWVINKKWLEDLGLPMPQTTDEFYNALKQFVNNDPNGNGKKDEQGFGMWEWNPNIYNPWGLTLNWSVRPMVVDEKGVTRLAWTTNNYREGIRFWKKCYDEGLVYKRALGTSYAEFQDLVKSGNVGCFIWPWAQTLFNETKLKDYVPFNYPTGSNTGDFKAGVSSHSNGVQPFRLVMSNKCSNKEAALRFLDYLYTPEGHLLKTYGTAGTFYTKVGGKYKMLTTDKNYLQYGLGDTLASYAQHDSVMLERHESELDYKEKWWNESTKTVKAMMTPRNPKYTLSTLMLNEAEAKRSKELWDAYDVAGSAAWGTSAIMGAKNVETEWNTYQAELQSKGAKELEQIYQAAFNRQYK